MNGDKEKIEQNALEEETSFDRDTLDQAPPSKDAIYHSRIFVPLLKYIRDKMDDSVASIFGAYSEAIKEFFDNGKISKENSWVNLDQLNTIMKEGRKLFDDEKSFMNACTYQLKESYGPLRFIFSATTPGRIYEKASPNFKYISNMSHGEVVESHKNSIVLRYYGHPHERRELCISRQAHTKVLPTLWGLPKARVIERSCISHGDKYCEYHVRYFDTTRLSFSFFGILLGIIGAIVLFASGIEPLRNLAIWLILPFIGAIGGYVISLRKVNARNLNLAEDSYAEFMRTVEGSDEDRRELRSIEERVKAWNARVQEQAKKRVKEQKALLEQMNMVQNARHDTIRGFSHDMKNPLQILRLSNALLSADKETLGPQVEEIVEEQSSALDRMETMLNRLHMLFTSEFSEIPLKPVLIDVNEFARAVERRIQALVLTKMIESNVLVRKNAPTTVVMDSLLLDRVMDNLLTNAAKYTDAGYIDIVFDGKPGIFSIKISDTGRGIANHRLKTIFMPEGALSNERERGSWGVGLSVVVRLFARIGARLEVASTPNQGTTFWIHLPSHMEDERLAPDTTLEQWASEGGESMIDKVVVIHPSEDKNNTDFRVEDRK